jgi:antitoxin (DNA-binding transcriptional repressor) of toxin-antitoxin stability system
MKAMKLPRSLESLLAAAEAAEEETLVFTEKKRPVAALVSLKKVDRESLALSTHSGFMRIIEGARKELRAGRTVSLEELERRQPRTKSDPSSPRRRG